MVSRSFRAQCIIRVLLLAATIFLFTRLLSSGQPVTLFVCGAVVVIQIVALIRYVECTNRNVRLFLQSIEFSDFTQRPHPGPAGRSFAELSRAFSDILRRFGELRRVQEESLRTLHSVVQHVGIGVLAFDQDGRVEMLNGAAKKLLDVPVLRHTGDLASIHPELHRRLEALKPGERDLVSLSINETLQQIALQATELRQRERTITIVSMQNISLELNEREMEAWQMLIRVLTHEIKNSLTPIGSLAASVESRLAGEASDPKSREALQIIQRRSRELLKFVDSYRDLTHVRRPEYRTVAARDLVARVERLIEPQLRETAVSFRSTIDPENLTLTVDPGLIEQVLINLLLNALDVLEGRAEAEIRLEAVLDDRSRPLLRVTDNGPGIVAESLEKVFIPFYSTKKKGTGIGLSLSRQIARLHRGDLTVRSEPGVRTEFALRL